MAIYHFSSSVISRSQGRSAVACSAYRSAELLHDEKYGKTHDYTRKQDVLHTEILLPENSPEWMRDREKLWNGVEIFEKRKDAQLAREIQFSLPRELRKEQNILLAREFIQTQFVNKGMIADWAYHTDKASDGEWQPHVHVMLTLRKVNPEGFGQKVREWNRKEVLLEWREAWAETANRHLSLNGYDIQIDHRSNVERGIDLEPQYKIGTTVSRNQMARLEDHQRIARENGEKIYANPQIALDSLTRQQSTFTHQDLARLINRHTEGAEQFQQVFDKVKVSSEIIFLGTDDKGRERYTTQEMLRLETGMMQNASKMMTRERHAVSDKTKDLALSTRTLSEQQKAAFEHLTEKGDIKCVVGYAGSGKSYLLGAAKEAWEKEGFNVIGATLSGIAAENLEGSSGIESRTLASRMYYWDKGEQPLTSRDILVIDEAGMIGSRQMARIMEEVQKNHAKVVLVGDPEQLQAIDAGGAFRAISEQTGFAELTEIRRQTHEWQRQATQELARGMTPEALGRYRDHDHIHEFETQAMAKKAVIEQWNDVRISDPDKTQIILAYTRKDVQEINDMARHLRGELGELGEDHTFQTDRGEKQFAEHDRVYFLQNDRELGVKNGTLGTIELIEGKRITITLDRDRENKKGLETVIVDIEKYNQIDHGYAATIHKSQGVTVDRSYLLASRYMDRHAAYVGMSRHRDSADLFYSREEFKHERELFQKLGRARSKDISLDYSLSDSAIISTPAYSPYNESDKINKHFAEHRGIHVSEERDKEFEKEYEGIVFDDLDSPLKKGKEKNIEADLMSELGFSPEEVAKFNDERLESQPDFYREKDEFSDFMEAFERENPQLAKMLNEEIQTPLEKRAIAVEKACERIDTIMERGQREIGDVVPSDVIKKEIEKLEKFILSESQDRQVMECLKERSPHIKQQINEITQQHEKQKERQLERSFSLSL